MRRSPRSLTILIALAAIACLVLLQTGRTAAQTSGGSTITGTFGIESGNPGDRYFIWDAAIRQNVFLTISQATLRAAGGPIALNHRTVTVTGARSTTPRPAGGLPHATQATIAVQTLSAAGATAQAQAAASGNTRWLNLLCKFSDISTEPHPPSYYQGLFQQYAFPGLDSYWQEQSYGAISLANSTTDTQWHTMPHPVLYYLTVNGTNSSWDDNALWNDCTSVANEGVNPSGYYGVILNFNNPSGNENGTTSFASVGQGQATFNGITGSWSVAWFPNVSYQQQGVYAHETGHGYGFFHSSNTSDLTQYQDNWDVMGYQWASSLRDPTYGSVAMGTIAYNRMLNGWLSSSRTYTYSSGSVNVDLGQLDSAVAGGYSVIKVPIGGSTTHYYSIEYRINNGLLNAGQSYDNGLPTSAVLIFEVNTQGRSDSIPSYCCVSFLLGKFGGDGNNTYTPYFEWKAGDTFTTPDNVGISIGTLNAGETTVTITGGAQAAVAATDAWTNDGGSDWSAHKTVFSPGDPVRYVGAVNNPGAGTAAATMSWSVTGPAGSIASWSGTLITSAGTSWWGLPRTIPANACSSGSSASADASGGSPPDSVRPGTPGTPIRSAPSGASAGDAAWDAEPHSAASAASCSYTFQFSVSFGGTTTTKSSTFQIQTVSGCTGAGLAVTPPNQAGIGTVLTLSASSTNCSGTPQYRYWQYSGLSGAWTMLQDYSSATSMQVNTASYGKGSYTFAVTVRSQNSTLEREADVYVPYTITGCSTAGVTVTPAGSAPSGTTLTLSASSQGCNGTPQYRYWQYQQASQQWTLLKDYSAATSDQISTAGYAPGGYVFAVTVRSQGSTLERETDAYSAIYTLTPPPGCTSASLLLNPLSPQAVGTPLTLEASSAGCNGTPQYRYWLYKAATNTWTMLQDYSTATSFTLATTGYTAGSYTLAITVRSQGSTLEREKDAYVGYTLSAPTSGPCQSASVSIVPAGSATVGTVLTVNGTSSGCGGVAQYRLWRYSAATGWVLLVDYGSQATFTVNTAGYAPGSYTFAITVRSQGSSAEREKDAYLGYSLH